MTGINSTNFFHNLEVLNSFCLPTSPVSARSFEKLSIERLNEKKGVTISGTFCCFPKWGPVQTPIPRAGEEKGRGVRLPSPLQWDPVLERGPISCRWDPESPDVALKPRLGPYLRRWLLDGSGGFRVGYLAGLPPTADSAHLLSTRPSSASAACRRMSSKAKVLLFLWAMLQSYAAPFLGLEKHFPRNPGF